MEGKKYLTALCQFDKMGPSRLARLRADFDSWQAIWEADTRGLIDAGLEPNVASEFIAWRRSFSFEKLEKELARHDISVISYDERDYPTLLKHAYLPPPILYFRGSLKTFNRHTLAVVGSRKATPYGKQVAETIVSDIARSGIAVVSGLALGIDTLAHEATLTAGGATAAVLGAGLDAVYPAANYRLAERIVESGCLISEFKPGTIPFKGNFPRRNRLIAALALGTLVIEASEKSGALITARHALQENREVLAVPGSIFSPSAQGTNALIQAGARLITSATDVFAALRIEHLVNEKARPEVIVEAGEEEMIINCLSFEPTHINEIVRLTNLDMSAINSRLTIMEMKGLVRNLGNLSYIRLL